MKSGNNKEFKVLKFCKDYDQLLDALSFENLKYIENELEHYVQYLDNHDDINTYKEEYGNQSIVDGYEGLINTKDFIDQFKKSFNLNDSNQYLKKAFFYCDGKNVYEGYYFDDVSWNGWKVPFFTKDVVEQIAGNLQDEFYELKYNNSSKEYVLIDKSCIDIDNPNQDPREYSETYSVDTLVYEGKEIQAYAIGGFYLAWDLVDNKKNLEDDLEI